MTSHLTAAAIVLVAAVACTGGGNHKPTARPTPTTTPVLARSGSPPWVVCGVTLDPGGGAGLVVYDVSDNDVAVNHTTGDAVIAVQLDHDCNANPKAQIVPSAAATLVKAVPPDKPIAMILRPNHEQFLINFNRHSTQFPNRAYDPGHVTDWLLPYP
jgi:hypothetical protein